MSTDIIGFQLVETPIISHKSQIITRLTSNKFFLCLKKESRFGANYNLIPERSAATKAQELIKNFAPKVKDSDIDSDTRFVDLDKASFKSVN